MTPAAAPPEAPALSDFLSGRAEDRLVDLLAFALAAEGKAAPGQAGVERLRSRAASELADHAARSMHNRIEEIRRDAVNEHLGALRRPLGFAGIVLANLVALGLAGVAGLWLAQRPDLLAHASAWLGG